MSEKSKMFKVASVQAAPVFLDKKATVEKACELIAEAGRKKALLAVFPEAFIPAYPDWVWVVPSGRKPLLNELYAELMANAVTIPDEATKKICSAAKKAKIHVVMGVNERNTESSNASLYNTIIYIGSSGEILGKHRKLVPTGGERLVHAQGDGKTLEVYDTALGRMGGLICWENYMPLARQAMYSGGTQIYVAPTWDSGDTWLASMRHIAKEGGCFVVSSCIATRVSDIPAKYEFKKLYPPDKDWINVGNSCIVNPRGDVIAGPVSKEEAIIYADIDLQLIPASKWMLDVAGHYSRPDVFEFYVKKV